MAWSYSYYPALAELNQPPGKLLFERAIWGKVDNARSDFRWIARSPGFRGHLEEVESALKISTEEQPRKMPLWRPWKGRYYAVSCYPSRARDAVGRSGFLEKQIIEWEPKGLPAGLGALLLLPEAAAFQEDIATSRANDPRWVDLTFCLMIQPSKCSTDPLQHTIDKGLRDLQAYSDADLEAFFAALGSRKPAFLLAAREPLTPEALAALLLPLSAEKGGSISLAGWVPSRWADAEALQNWDAAACDPALQPQSASASSPDREIAAYARRCVQILRGFHPAVQRILEFADGPGRWIDPNEMNELRSMLYERSASDAEMEQLRLASERVMQDSNRSSGLREPLENARHKHLRKKALQIWAMANLLRPPAQPAQDDEVREILIRWRADSKGEVLSRITNLLK
jgi:hypothetical protein